MAKNRSKKYNECFIKRRTADVQEIFLFCCLSKKKYILRCPINRCKVSHHYFALLVDLSSFLKQNMSYANVVLVFHSPMRTSAKMDQYLPSRFFNRHADRSFFCCCWKFSDRERLFWGAGLRTAKPRRAAKTQIPTEKFCQLWRPDHQDSDLWLMWVLSVGILGPFAHSERILNSIQRRVRCRLILTTKNLYIVENPKSVWCIMSFVVNQGLPITCHAAFHRASEKKGLLSIGEINI